VSSAAWDGLMMGTGFLLVLVVMGGVREALGQGPLLAGLQTLGLPDMTIHLVDGGFLLVLLPPGAFLTLGCLIAMKNVLEGSNVER
jgi:electron transport complex protein RnfE